MELLIAAIALCWTAFTSVSMSKKKAELHNDPVWQLKNTWREREHEIAEQESVAFWSKMIEQQGKILEGSLQETTRWNPKPTSKPSRPRKEEGDSIRYGEKPDVAPDPSMPPKGGSMVKIKNNRMTNPLNMPQELEFTKGTKLVLKDKVERMNTKAQTGLLVCPKCFDKGMAHYPGCENYDWFCHSCHEQYFDYNSYEVVRGEEEVKDHDAHFNHVAAILDMTMNQKRAALGLKDTSDNSKDELLHDLIHYIKSRECISRVYADNKEVTSSIGYDLDNEELRAYVDLYFDK